MSQLEDDAPKRASIRDVTSTYPYTPSIASAASSSTSSIFSNDGRSSQSSAPSSVKSGSSGWDTDSSAVAPAVPPEYQPHNAGLTLAARLQQQSAVHVQQLVQPAAPVAPALRLNPRRTQPSGSLVEDGKAAARAPPALVRQCDRKDNFVESLVDTTTQMIEVIWPLSVTSLDRDSVLGGKNLIGLRTFIQEVLKRSKTSYSTLQVALYYLVLIKPCIPRVDFTQEQTEDTHALRAMQCGRRMFLAALILASKYLQDRNYSARAWSKISGLKVSEINSNEMAFVTAVNWKLHIPEPRFQRWADIVFKYSTSQSSSSSSSPLRCREPAPISWRSVVPRLTPDLDEFEIESFAKLNLGGDGARCDGMAMSPPCLMRAAADELPTSGEATPTPTPASIKPQALEPTPRASKENFRFPPISPRITQLPTPVMTPRTTGFYAPAAGIGSYCRGQSMSDAMKQIHRSSMERCTIDAWPSAAGAGEAFHRRCPLPGRRPSYALSASSTISSPESMISDLGSQSSCSSRTSRSSSVCSVASSAGALSQPSRLAVQATRRCATMAVVKEQECSGLALDRAAPCHAIWAEPGVFAGHARESYVRGSEGLNESAETTAAMVLSDLAGGKPCFGIPLCTKSQLGGSLRRKRERPCSVTDASFDAEVRALLPKTLEGLGAGDEGVVVPDRFSADSFLLREGCGRLPLNRMPTSRIRSASGSRDGVRKRTCNNEAWTKSDMTMSPLCV